MIGMALPGSVSSDTPRALATPATAVVATAAVRPAARPVRHSEGVEVREAVVVVGLVEVVTAVIEAPWVSGPVASDPHLVYERPTAGSTAVREFLRAIPG